MLNFSKRTQTLKNHTYWVWRVNTERLSFLVRNTVVWFKVLWDGPGTSIIWLQDFGSNVGGFLNRWLMQRGRSDSPVLFSGCSGHQAVSAFVTCHHMCVYVCPLPVQNSQIIWIRLVGRKILGSNNCWSAELNSEYFLGLLRTFNMPTCIANLHQGHKQDVAVHLFFWTGDLFLGHIWWDLEKHYVT